MTHRSRTGGPPAKHKQGKTKSDGPKKLHHPPSKNAPPPKSKSTSDTEINTNNSPNPNERYTYLTTTPTDTEILSIIHTSLESTLNSPEFVVQIQKIKSLLYDRQWLALFEDATLLEAYAGRWVPGRVLCFREMFASLSEIRDIFMKEDEGQEEEVSQDGDRSGTDGDMDGLANGKTTIGSNDEYGDDENANDKHSDRRPPSSNGQSRPKTHILSLGGGAGSELLAFASLVHSSNLSPVASDHSSPITKTSFHWTALDIGPWSPILTKFTNTINTKWHLSPSSQSPSQATSNPKNKSTLDIVYDQTDLLSSTSTLSSYITPQTNLVTLLFTLSELLSQSRTGTIHLLNTLTERVSTGGLVLVADSASDISDLEIGSTTTGGGGGGRKWPNWMIVDAVLLSRRRKGDGEGESKANAEGRGTAEGKQNGVGKAQSASSAAEIDGEAQGQGRAEEEGPRWELVKSDESRWYRLPPGLGTSWKVKLENTRYWFRLYRRL